MKFEHLIEINDLGDATAPIFTREQLWNGLVLRAEFPTIFLPNLDNCIITSRKLDSLTRTLQFGQMKVHDQVYFHFLDHVYYRVHKQGELPESTMRMTIEEPSPLHLSVRFSYRINQIESEEQENVLYEEYRRSAYVQADIETVNILRQMHLAGRLNNLLT